MRMDATLHLHGRKPMLTSIYFNVASGNSVWNSIHKKDNAKPCAGCVQRRITVKATPRNTDSFKVLCQLVPGKKVPDLKRSGILSV